MPYPANDSNVPRSERRSAEHDPMHRTTSQIGCNLMHPLSAASVASSKKWPSSWCSIPGRFAKKRKTKDMCGVRRYADVPLAVIGVAVVATSKQASSGGQANDGLEWAVR
jgi:hypothetical protein